MKAKDKEYLGYQDFGTKNEVYDRKVDLNDLLQRSRNLKKKQTKDNLIIFSVAASLVFVAVLVLSL